MPPSAMRSSERSTTSSDSASPTRRSSSRAIVCGNFGAWPNPPCTGSCCDRSAAAADASASGEGMPWSPAASSDDRRMASVSCPPCSSTSSRRCCQASAMASSSWVNDGMPWRGSGGKYVPP